MAWTAEELDTAMTEYFEEGISMLRQAYEAIAGNESFEGVTAQDVADSAARLVSGGVIEEPFVSRVPRNPNMNYVMTRSYRSVV